VKVYLSNKNSESEINFQADKVYVHRWPMDSQHWSSSFTEEIDHLNKNKEKKSIRIKETLVQINNYNFDRIKKIGVTVPLFKKETTMVFEGKIQDFYAHVHITAMAKNYLEIFNALMGWKNNLSSR
jgi:hypothetical protein